MAIVRQIKPMVLGLDNRKRVAAYASVSMDTEQLQHSLSAQISAYSTIIQANPEWVYAGVFYDEGISGRSMKNRNGFIAMLEACEEGKIDMILVKSISRFARDTVDCLNTIRHLKELGIAVVFERERINTMTGEGELLLTLLASFAQEESRSISENVKWGIRKRFEQGIPNGHKPPYGYRWDGEMFRVIPEEGAIVKEIYSRYLAGESAYAIAKSLAARGVKGRAGNPIEQTTIKDMFMNTCYMGTMMLQKYFFTEGRKRRKNCGELPRFYVDGLFEPLVTEENHARAVELRRQNAEKCANINVELMPFSGKMKCGVCGCGLSRRSPKGYKKWTCNTKEKKGMAVCNSRPINEDELFRLATKALGLRKFDKDKFNEKIELITVRGDVLEFKFKSGAVKEVRREYDGSRGKNPFTNKCYCGTCGGKCERDTYPKGYKVWRCSKPKEKCQMKYLRETELFEASKEILGQNYQGEVVENIAKIVINDDAIDFVFKDGREQIWQRQ